MRTFCAQKSSSPHSPNSFNLLSFSTSNTYLTGQALHSSAHSSAITPIPLLVFMFLLLSDFQSLSVEQDEGLEFFGDVSPVVKAVLDDGPGG